MNHTTFTGLLASQLYPILRAEGFRGSGTTLRRINGPGVAVFNVQASAGGARCYLNLGAHAMFLPTAGVQLLEAKELKEAQCAFRVRLTPPPGQYRGWVYGSSLQEAQANVDLAIQALQTQGKAFFARHAYPDGLAQLVDEVSLAYMHPNSLLTLARVALELERRDRAIDLAQSALDTVPASAGGLKAAIVAFLLQARAV